MRWILALLVVIFFSSGRAARVEVVQADRLELRKIEDHELIVLYGRPVKLVLEDGRQVEADVVEYYRDTRRLLLLRNVLYVDKEKRIIESNQLELYLNDESMDTLEVHMRSGDIDLWGPEATRVLGQILMTNGHFTPCARCGQQPFDYAFSAKKLVLYPGDRLIAYEVTVYVQGQPYFSLPILMLHFSQRRPRLEIHHNDTDGWSLAADLPYVTDGGLGFTLLRYFQNRGWGFGFDHWGVGVAYEHYRALYLPPEVGDESGSLNLNLTYREGDKRLRTIPHFIDFHFEYNDAWPLPEKPRWRARASWRDKNYGWRRSLVFERRDLPGRNRVWLTATARHESGPDPQVGLRVRTYFDLGEEGAKAARTVPEVTLKWPKGWSSNGFSIKGSASLGVYYDRTNELNRSARAAGVWALAGRVFVNHTDIYNLNNPWPGFTAHFENRFSGWYYDTSERQVDWRNVLNLRQKLGGLRVKAAAKRTVVEGEAFFARDHRRPQHELTVEAAASWNPQQDFSLEAKSGWDVWKNTYQKLFIDLSWTPRPVNFSFQHVYDPQTGLNMNSSASLRLKLGKFTGKLNSGYNYQTGKYSSLNFTSSYALPGGNAQLKHVYDLNNARSKSTQASITLQLEHAHYFFQEKYNYKRDLLNGRITASWNGLSLSFSHTINLTSDTSSPSYRQSRLQFSAAWREHKLFLAENWDGRRGRFGPGYLNISSKYTGLRQTWRLNARWHLPEEGDEEIYLKNAFIKGGIDLLIPTPEHPGLSLQGSFDYLRRSPDNRELTFKNFGFTAAWLADEHTRLFISMIVNQKVRTSEGWPPLEPRFVFTLDRCCWAMQFTVDAANPSAKLSFIYGGKSARFLFDDSGIHYPWDGIL